MSEFGAVLRRFRQAAGLSQERLAEASGVSVEAVKTLEAGRRRRPRASTVESLSRGLGLNGEQFAELAAAVVGTDSSSGSAHRLPDDVPDFVGRADQIESVTGLLSGAGGDPGVVVISAIAGMGGAGKTALAVRAAYEVMKDFPDGVHYLNLRGFGPGEPMTSLEALTALLRVLDVRLNHLPESADEAATYFRSACAGRRLLFLLDDVAATDQIVNLLPGTSTCAVVITSRRTLTAIPGAKHLLLDILPEAEALALLTAVAGAEQIEADPEAAREVVKLCGSLPLALRIAGTRLATEPDWTIAGLRQRLADEAGRLDVLTGEAAGVRASIAMSLSGLSARDAAADEVFRLLGLYEGDEFDVRVAARVTDRPAGEVGPVLERLVDLHLLETVGVDRYRFHDLVRAYARELVADVDRAAARLRVLSLYAGFAWRARTRNGTGQLSADWFDETWVVGTEDLDSGAAMAWLDHAADEILAAADRVATGSPAELAMVVRIAVGMVAFWTSRRRDLDGIRLGRLALSVLEPARELAAPQAMAMLSYDVANHYAGLSDYEPAARLMTTSISEAAALGYQQHQMYSLNALGGFLERLGQVSESRARLETGLGLAQAMGDGFAEAEARLWLGVLAGRDGQPDEQDRQFELAYELTRDVAPVEWYYFAETIGRSLREGGRLREASHWLGEAIEQLRPAPLPVRFAELHWHLGLVDVEMGEFTAAVEHLETGLELIGDGSWELEARIRHALGRALDGLGETEAARRQWQQALQLYSRHGQRQAEEVRQLLGAAS